MADRNQSKIDEMRDRLQELVSEILANDAEVITLTHSIASERLNYTPDAKLDVDPYDDPKHKPFLNATHQELAITLIKLAKDELKLQAHVENN